MSRTRIRVQVCLTGNEVRTVRGTWGVEALGVVRRGCPDLAHPVPGARPDRRSRRGPGWRPGHNLGHQAESGFVFRESSLNSTVICRIPKMGKEAWDHDRWTRQAMARAEA